MKAICLLIISLPIFANIGLYAATESSASNKAVISWGCDVQGSGGSGGTIVFFYYWNGTLIGYGKAAFPLLYDKIKQFKGDRIIYKRESGRKGGHMGDTHDPFFEEHNFTYFRLLFRQKELFFEIDPIVDLGLKTVIDSENPFREEVQNPPKKDKIEGIRGDSKKWPTWEP